MKLRPYQDEAKVDVFDEWKDRRATLVVMPTGTGKTVLFAAIIQDAQPSRCLVIAHREELISQARDKIERLTGLQCEVEMADMYANNSLFHDTPVIISTVQTQNAPYGDRTRMSRFKPEDFGVLVIDEAHHATAKSYQNLIHYYSQNPKLKILGVTATPDRADEEALSQVFESVAFDYEILDAIHDGWLVPIEQVFVQVHGLDFSEMRTTAGDLNNADLSAVMEAEENMQGVASASIQIIGKKRALVFTASVKQAEMLSDIYQRHGIVADWVSGKTPKDERRSKLSRFSSGEMQVMCNCGVLTEGFDDPGVECIIMARPTKSRSLYAQMCGRSTRPLAGIVDPIEDDEGRRQAIAQSAKPCCTIVDFVGNSGRHKLMSSADILNGNASEEAVSRAIKVALKSGGPVRMDEAIDEAVNDIAVEIEERRRRDAARKAKVVAKASFSKSTVNPFDILDLNPVKERSWDKGKVLSERQRSMLLKMGINPDTMPFAQGRQVLAEVFRRINAQECTFGQAKVLKRYGLDTKVSKTQASQWLDAISKNNWKLPAQLPKVESKPKDEHQSREEHPHADEVSPWIQGDFIGNEEG